MKAKNFSILRSRILDECIAKQQHQLDDFNSRIKNILAHEGLGNEDEYDNTELGQSSQQADEINAINESLSFANSDMNVLQYLKTLYEVQHSVPEPGAVIVTNRGKFFISISVGQVNVDDEIFTGLSTRSQLFQSMKGMHAGDTFEFGKNRYTIQEIF